MLGNSTPLVWLPAGDRALSLVPCAETNRKLSYKIESVARLRHLPDRDSRPRRLLMLRDTAASARTVRFVSQVRGGHAATAGNAEPVEGAERQVCTRAPARWRPDDQGPARRAHRLVE